MNLILEYWYLSYLIFIVIGGTIINFVWTKNHVYILFGYILSFVLSFLLFMITSLFSYRLREETVLAKNEYVISEIPDIGYSAYIRKTNQTLIFNTVKDSNLIKNKMFNVKESMWADMYKIKVNIYYTLIEDTQNGH